MPTGASDPEFVDLDDLSDSCWVLSSSARLGLPIDAEVVVFDSEVAVLVETLASGAFAAAWPFSSTGVDGKV